MFLDQSLPAQVTPEPVFFCAPFYSQNPINPSYAPRIPKRNPACSAGHPGGRSPWPLVPVPRNRRVRLAPSPGDGHRSRNINPSIGRNRTMIRVGRWATKTRMRPRFPNVTPRAQPATLVAAPRGRSFPFHATAACRSRRPSFNEAATFQSRKSPSRSTT